MIKYIFFDLDGTLIDSREGITKAFEYSLNYFNIKVEDRKTLEIFIGPPLRDSFIDSYGFTEEQAENAVTKYREYYSQKGVKENTLYNGISELLENLKSSNKILIIATSKPTAFTEQILEMHNIKKYFSFISGATIDKTRNNKTDIIKYAIENMKIANTKECIMVGDKEHDIIGANKNNMQSIGVIYGFGSKEELENNKATYIANTTKEIEEIVLAIK